MKIRYFAFGSNMRTSRLEARLDGVRCLGPGSVRDWVFACNKSGLDGSAKANLLPQTGATAWGVIYELPAAELARLDYIEGGYQRISIQVDDTRSQRVACQTYVSDRLTDDPTPFDWYKQLLVTGAREHHLPPPYVALLERLPYRTAPPEVGDRRGLGPGPE